jgi:hypothetical protein
VIYCSATNVRKANSFFSVAGRMERKQAESHRLDSDELSERAFHPFLPSQLWRPRDGLERQSGLRHEIAIGNQSRLQWSAFSPVGLPMGKDMCWPCSLDARAGPHHNVAYRAQIQEIQKISNRTSRLPTNILTDILSPPQLRGRPWK